MQKKKWVIDKKTKNFVTFSFRGVRPPCPSALNFSPDDTRFYVRNLKYVRPTEPCFSMNFCGADLNGVGMFICHSYWKMSISTLLFIVNVMKKKITMTAIRIAPFVSIIIAKSLCDCDRYILILIHLFFVFCLISGIYCKAIPSKI